MGDLEPEAEAEATQYWNGTRHTIGENSGLVRATHKRTPTRDR